MIFDIIFAVILAVVGGFAIPWIRANTTEAQQLEITAWCKIAVTAAEQIFTGCNRGTEKKAYVVAWLQGHGINLDETKLDALIESAVYELNNGGGSE